MGFMDSLFTEPSDRRQFKPRQSGNSENVVSGNSRGSVALHGSPVASTPTEQSYLATITKLETKLEASRREQSARMTDHEALISALQKRHRDELSQVLSDRDSLADRVQVLLCEVESQERRALQEKTALMAHNSAAMSALQQEFHLEVTEVIKEAQRSLEAAKAQHKEELAHAESEQHVEQRIDLAQQRLTKDYMKAVEVLKHDHELALDRVKDNSREIQERNKTQHAAAMAELREQHTNEVELLKQRSEREKEDLTSRYNARMASMRKQLQACQTNFSTQEFDTFLPVPYRAYKVPSLSDDIVRMMLMDINHFVRDLANTPWKAVSGFQPTASDDPMKGPREQVGRLRSLLLRDLIWTSLYHFLLRAPFVMFDDIGEDLANAWASVCNADSSDTQTAASDLTMLSAAAETWRCRTIIECHDAIRTELSFDDPRQAVKAAWDRHEARLIKDLGRQLEPHCTIDNVVNRRIHDICRSARSMWLCLMMQRCKFLMRIPGSEGTLDDKIKKINDTEPIALTSQPCLVRYGSYDGTDLTEHHPIAGCEGEIFELPHRSPTE